MSAKSNKSLNLQIGNNIRQERLKAGMTQPVLAEKLGLEPNSLSSVERGHVGISIEKLIKICKIFSIPSDRLLFGKVEKSDVQDMTERLERLSPEQLRVARNVLNDMLDAFSLDSAKGNDISKSTKRGDS